MNPSSRNNHGVTLAQIDLDDLVDHVAEPCMTLYFASRPAFVGSKIGRSWAYEEEGLGENIIMLDDVLRGDKPSIP